MAKIPRGDLGFMLKVTLASLMQYLLCYLNPDVDP